MNRDDVFMRRALELAARGGLKVAPNPQVGAVLVKSGKIIAEGWHREFGAPHAEAVALRRADAEGATLYVNLEPCSPHPKKTPPCAELLASSGLARLVVGMKDPNPMVDGRGLALLRKAGIKVATGVLEAEARALNAPFVKFHTRGLPYVVCKWAMTLDGKIATRTGDSRWVSGDRSRAWLHRWRDSFHAILVGSGTVQRDDPSLRGAKTRPTRIVLDSNASTPLSAQVVHGAREHPTILAVSPYAPERRVKALRKAGVRILELDVRDLRVVFEALAGEGLHRILVEGGGEVHASVLAAGVADEAVVFIAPKLAGGRDAKTPVEGEGVEFMGEARGLKDVVVERLGEDVLLRGRLA